MTVLVALLGLIFLIIIHELGHMLTAKAMGVRVPEFSVGFGPPLIKKKFGKTVYSFRIILLGGFAKMAGMGDDEEGPDTYHAKPAWRRALIILAGPAANVVAAVLILACCYMFYGVTDVKPVVTKVEPHSTAQEVGIRPGDQIVALDGSRVKSWDGFQRQMVDREPGENVSVTVVRDGSRKTFEGELGTDPQDKQHALLGVKPKIETTTYGPVKSLGIALQTCWKTTVQLGQFVGQLVTGEKDFYKNVTGPVGITSVGSTAVSLGFFLFLQLLAFISLNLALFNLLPILPLDGGHLFFIAAEKVLGRPVSEQTMGKFAAFGVVLVLALFLFATYADLSKLFTGQSLIPN